MKYTSLYRDQQEIFKSNASGRAVLKGIFGKKTVGFPTYVKVMKDLILSNSTSDVWEGDHCKLLCHELQWRESGSPVIFLETKGLVNYLYGAKLNFEDDFNVSPPFKSFAMSFPENTVINGITLKSCLVTIMARREFIALYGEENIKLQDLVSYESENDAIGICIHYESTNGVINTNFTPLATLNDCFKKNFENPLANGGTKMLEAQSKIALALCVYHSATNGDKLEKGYPSSSISLPKNKSKGSYKAVTIRSFKEKQSSDGNSQRKITHRIPHFRNLRAERFYKKEQYKNMKRGTRWTFVKEVDVYGSINTLLS